MVKRKLDGSSNEPKQVVTVKCTLAKRCLNRELYEQIQRDVIDISRLSVEASVYIHYSLMRDWSRNAFTPTIDFTKYFYALRETPAKPKAKRAKDKIDKPVNQEEYKLDDEYKKLRGNLPFPEARFKFNEIQNAKNCEIEELAKSTVSPMQENYLECTQNRLRLPFDKYRRTEQAAHKLAKKIIGKDAGKTLIIIGSSKVAVNSPIRGYVRTPQPKLLEALKARVDVLEINEFRTTKLCCNCHKPAVTSTSPHRDQFCPNCGISYNRDVNAGINILNIGIAHHILGHQLRQGFQRNQPTTNNQHSVLINLLNIVLQVPV